MAEDLKNTPIIVLIKVNMWIINLKDSALIIMPTVKSMMDNG